MNLKLLGFYLDTGPDSEGRMLQDILKWQDPKEWEKCHNFIQWVFPLPEASAYNPNAPILDAETLEVFKRSQLMQTNAGKAYVMAQRFLWQQREAQRLQPTWLQPGDHNHLRITRIIRFFNLLGFTKAANHILRVCSDYARKFPGTVSDTTLDFWEAAALPIESQS